MSQFRQLSPSLASLARVNPAAPKVPVHGATLRQLIVDRGMNVFALGQALGAEVPGRRTNHNDRVTQTLLAVMEQGVGWIETPTLALLAEVLDVHPDSLRADFLWKRIQRSLDLAHPSELRGERGGSQ